LMVAASSTVALAKIALPVMVPMVVVLNPATFSDPVTGEKVTAFITRSGPTSSKVRRLSPVALVPLPMTSGGKPVTVDPYEFRCRSRRHHINHAGWRRGANTDTDRDLSTENRAHGHDCCCEQCHHD